MNTHPSFIQRVLQVLDEILDLVRQIVETLVGQRDVVISSSAEAEASGSETNHEAVTIHELLHTICGRVDRLHRTVEGNTVAMRDELSRLQSLVLMGRRKYSRGEAAERLGVSVKTLDRRIREGLLVSSQEGGRVFVTEQAIRDYEDAQRRAA